MRSNIDFPQSINRIKSRYRSLPLIDEWIEKEERAVGVDVGVERSSGGKMNDDFVAEININLS